MASDGSGEEEDGGPMQNMWGVPSDSSLRRDTRDLVLDALKITASSADGSCADELAARISSRVLIITAKEMEVDWYRSFEGRPIPETGSDSMERREVDFDPRKDDTDIVPLKEQNIQLEVNFSAVHFPDNDGDREDDLRRHWTKSSAENTEQVEILSQERLGEVDEALSSLLLTIEEAIKLAKLPHEARADKIETLRLLLIVAPTEEETNALRTSRSKRRGSAEEFMYRLLEVPSARHRVEVANTMLTYKGHVAEVMDVLGKYSRIAQEIVESEQLATTLRMSLRLFNRVLLGEDEAEAEGFSLDILPSLRTERNPADNNRTLLSTIVRTILRTLPGILPFEDMPTLGGEMMYMPNLEDVEGVIAELYCSLETVAEFCEHGDDSDPLVVAASKFMSGRKGGKKLRSSLVCEHGVLRMSLQRMMSFFGEENVNNRTRQMHIIRTLWTFSRDVDSAVMQAKVSELTVKLACGA